MSKKLDEKKLKKTLYNLIQVTKIELENENLTDYKRGKIEGRLSAYSLIYDNFFIYPDPDYFQRIKNAP